MSPNQLLAEFRAATAAHGDLHLAATRLFLDRCPEPLKNAFAAAAIPHWFDESILGKMLAVQAGPARSEVEALSHLPIVDRFPVRSGWRVHESVRLAFREEMRTRHPEEFVRLSRQAMEAFDPSGSAVDRIEHLFHVVCAAPDRCSVAVRRLVRWVVNRGRSHETQFLFRALEEIATAGDRWPELPARVWLALAATKADSASSTELRGFADQAMQRLGAQADGVDRADAHELLGQVQRLVHGSAEALAEFQQAAGILERLTESEAVAGEIRRDLANLHIEMGRSFLTLGSTQEALRSFTVSLEILQRLVGSVHEPAPADWRLGLGIAWNSIGEACLRLGDTSQSATAIESYRSIMAALVNEDPDNGDWQRELAVATFCTGELQRVHGQADSALASFRSAAVLLERLMDWDPGNAVWLRDLSEARNGCGIVMLARRDFAGALDEFLAARSIRERLLQRDPENTESRRELGIIHNNLGRAYEAQGRVAEAYAEYLADLEVIQALANAEPENMEWHRDLSVCHLNIARIHRAMGRNEPALAAIRRALEIRERLVRLDPRNVDWQRDLAIAARHLGEYLDAQGRSEEAEAAYTTAEVVFAGLVARDASVEAWRRDLEKVRARLTKSSPPVAQTKAVH
jgi:tetratricopeptide (TPR) repeat protein